MLLRKLKNLARKMQQQLDKMLDWLDQSVSGKPYVVESGGILALHFDKFSIQSEMCIARPDELIIAYTRVMMSFLLFEPLPLQIAMIGLGGGSLLKYCYRYLPQADISVIEIDPAVIALRREFAIPEDDARLRVLTGCGAEWIAQTAGQDVLIVDGYDSEGLPEKLCSQAFYDDCFASLTEHGILVVNLWSGYPHYDTYLARINHSFAGNTVVVAADVNHVVFAVKNSHFPPTASAIRHHAGLLGPSHPINFQQKANQLIRALSMRAS